MLMLQRVLYKKWPSQTQSMCIIGICCACTAYTLLSMDDASGGGDLHWPSMAYMVLSAFSLALFGTLFEFNTKKLYLVCESKAAEQLRCMLWVEISRALTALLFLLAMDGQAVFE